ncbi:MAG TPA: sulfatase-like hydrolase/transferase [Alphaproteobacteria bacterium]|nr:sulfatase-like hydrolase/transferase [Alphaproteobacteria bacterium]
MAERPNILLIITDQQRADHLGCAGHPVLKTPNIDRIAEAGVRFERFYVSTPVCMPNRATLMTGRLPSVHGVRHNGIPLSCAAVTFVELLRAAGYRTALIGKSHLQTQTGRPPLSKAEPVPEGYDPPPEDLREARRRPYADGAYDQELPQRWASPDARVDTPFYGFEHVELCKGHGDDVSGNYRQWLRSRHPAADSLIGEKNQLPGNTYTVPQAWRTAVPEELHHSAYIAERVEAWLAHHARTDRGRPFFLMASFPDPHHPFTPPGRYWDMYAPADMPRPAAFQANDWRPPPHVAELIAAHERGDKVTDHIMAHGIGLKEALEARALTCGSISFIDAAVGRMTEALAASGLADTTIVIFTSDHGEHLGDHKLLLKGLAHYDELLRVPFIWSDPEAGAPGAVTRALAGTIDVAATILDRTRLRPFNGLQGRSFAGVLREPASPHRAEMLIEDENQRVVAGLGPRPRERTLVTEHWRLSVFLGHAWGELYDLAEDPHEFRNLWDAPAAQSTKAELMARLVQQLTAACDRSPAPLHQA